jgi:MarR family transcriptional regulator, 2-MHQ and catechol-resistance regulon repressor
MERMDPKTEAAMEAYRQLRRAAESVGDLLNRQVTRFGVTPAQFRVLEALLLNGPLRQDRLARQIFMNLRRVRYVTADLEKQVFLVKRQDEEDGRYPMVHLTPQGRALITKIFPHQAKLIRAQMIALGAGEQRMLKRLCTKLADGDMKRFLSEITMVEGF